MHKKTFTEKFLKTEMTAHIPGATDRTYDWPSPPSIQNLLAEGSSSVWPLSDDSIPSEAEVLCYIYLQLKKITK